jgi:hypothetical protein
MSGHHRGSWSSRPCWATRSTTTSASTSARAFSSPGATARSRAFSSVLLNRKHLDRAHAFFEKYGGKAVILARFVPIVRTFVPFVAGAGAMNYSKFFLYNVVGALALGRRVRRRRLDLRQPSVGQEELRGGRSSRSSWSRSSPWLLSSSSPKSSQRKSPSPCLQRPLAQRVARTPHG